MMEVYYRDEDSKTEAEAIVNFKARFPDKTISKISKTRLFGFTIWFNTDSDAD